MPGRTSSQSGGRCIDLGDVPDIEFEFGSARRVLDAGSPASTDDYQHVRPLGQQPGHDQSLRAHAMALGQARDRRVPSSKIARPMRRGGDATEWAPGDECQSA